MVNLKNLTERVRIAVLIKMKTPKDPRHKKREKIIKELFSWGFHPSAIIKDKITLEIIKEIKKIDQVIQEAAPEWPISKINRIDLAILRLAIYELLIRPIQPPRVIIDEAVELGKTYGGEKSPAFINGVLGTVFKKYNEKK